MGRPRKTEEQTQEQVEETPAEEPEAQAAPAAEDEPAAEEPEVDDAPVAKEAPAAEEEPAPEPVAEEEPAAAEEPVAAAEEPPARVAEPKPKRKRVRRGERRQRSKPTREKAAKRKSIARLPKPEHVRGTRKERRGVVVSAAMDKTIVVRVDTVKPHPVYKKIVRRSSRLHVHDEENAAKLGDLVRVVETRPLSRTKHWRLAEVLEEAK